MRAQEFVSEPKLVDVDGIKLAVKANTVSVYVRALASDGARELGHVYFDRDGSTLVADELKVNERFRGQGIAKIMYDYIKSMGFEIKRSADQTDDGRAFWDRNRGSQGEVWEDQEFVSENWGVSKEPIPLPIGDYLADGSDEFAPPGNYRSAEDLHNEVLSLIDAGVDPQVVNIDPRTVLATQDWLSNAGGDDPLFDEYPDRPVIYQKAGKLYILDGHHRTTRAWKAGRPIGVYLFSDQQQQDLDESAGTYREIEFVCANPDFCDATDPEQQQQLHQQLRKIPGVIPVYQDQSDYSAGQFSLTAIYQTAAQRRQIMAAARALGVSVDLVQPVDDDYVDRAVRGELEGQIQENFADGKVKGKSRPGRVKRAGASCNGSVTDLRARAKKASGERAKMLHWCANMKSGKKK